MLPLEASIPGTFGRSPARGSRGCRWQWWPAPVYCAACVRSRSRPPSPGYHWSKICSASSGLKQMECHKQNVIRLSDRYSACVGSAKARLGDSSLAKCCSIDEDSTCIAWFYQDLPTTHKQVLDQLNF